MIIGSHNNYIILTFIDDGTDEVDNKNMNRTILDGNVVNMSLIIIEGNDGAINADDSKCIVYYNIIFY